MPRPSLITSRFACPCCGYPTLGELANYEICELCNWEDDGQGEAEANEVWGGPNSDYSLTEARQNFLQYRVIYAPGRDQRITKGDSTLEYETKGLLLEAFTKLQSSPHPVPEVEAEVARLEKVLRDETTRQIREHERRGSSGA
jgi:Cysteine-rich CPCC